MLHSHLKPTLPLPEAVAQTPAAKPAVPPPLGGRPSDSAVDAALRRVPMPEGLLSRLNAMLGTMADEIAARTD